MGLCCEQSESVYALYYSKHLEAVYRVLKYLKGIVGPLQAIFQENQRKEYRSFTPMQNRLLMQVIVGPLQAIAHIYGET